MHPILLVLSLAACTSLTPSVGLVPADGREVAVDFTDAGRVALGQLIGPEVARAEGKLIAAKDSSLTISLSSLTSFSGGKTTWSGELVTLNPSHIRQLYIKKVDSGRSVLLAGVAAGSFAAFIATRSLGGGANSEPDPDPPPGENQRRGRWR